MKAANPKKTKKSRTAFLVLGMHRSGTSALAGLLAKLGCDTPATEMKPTADNERGYFESNRIYQLHTRLLDSAGTSWDGWDAVSPSWLDSPRGPEYRDKALEVLEQEFGDSTLFVLKDPRICRLLPLWLDVLDTAGCRPLVVHTHRNPIQVAQSLKRRDGLVPELSMLIWLRHILEAERDSRGLPRYFTSYDRLLGNWGKVVTGLQETLKTTLPRQTESVAREVEKFLSADLKHFDTPAEQLLENPQISTWVRDIFAVLERWADTGEDTADHQVFDTVRAQLDLAAPTISGLIRASQDLSEKLDRLSGAREEDTARIAELETALADSEARLHESNSALEQRRHEADDIRRSLKDAETDLAEKTGRISALSEQLTKAEADIKSRFMELANMTMALVRKENDIEARERNLAELRAELHERGRSLEMKSIEIEALRRSTSWKLTAPIRGLGRVFGRH